MWEMRRAPNFPRLSHTLGKSPGTWIELSQFLLRAGFFISCEHYALWNHCSPHLDWRGSLQPLCLLAGRGVGCTC